MAAALTIVIAFAACSGDDDEAGPVNSDRADTAAVTGESTHPGSAVSSSYVATAPSTSAADPTTTVAPPTTTERPAPLPAIADLQGISLTATQITDVEMLTSIAWRAGDLDPYLADQHGTVYHLVDGTAEPVLDLTANVLDYVSGAEYGMLAMTFDPRNGRIVVGYNGNDVHTRIESYAVGEDGRPDPDSVWEILRVEQPAVGHNSGQLAFGRDNTLYIAMGDGGGSRGADAQNMTKLLGGILRIRPNTDGPGYTVPADNPYVDRDGIAPEIWAKGMRNPWRFSIDHPTGDIWIGEVGESTWESVFRIPAGQAGVNFGWPTYQGGHEVNFNSNVHVPSEWTLPPVHAYNHADVGPAIIGGYVYRGSAIPQLAGAYLFMDMVGPMFALGAGGEVVRVNVEIGGLQTSFGEGPDGELYVLTLRNGAFKLGPG
jgi:hypothetical protein